MDGDGELGLEKLHPNPMPESCTDRPTKSHETIWMLTKSARYWYDAEAVKETSIDPESRNGRRKRNDDKFVGQFGSDTRRGFSKIEVGKIYSTRNMRDVWTISTESYSGNHFATFPQELVLRCLKASTSERGACPKCGKQWVRIIEKSSNWQERKKNGAGSGTLEIGHNAEHGENMSHDLYSNVSTLGFRPGCECGIETTRPALVLDIFCGSGTTLAVAKRMGLNAVGIDLSFQYLKENAKERIGIIQPLMV